MTIEDRLTGLLHERADRPVDADSLLAAALTRGRARTRRRHGAYAVAGAGMAGLTAATLLLNLDRGPVDDNPAAAGWDTVPALPAAAGEAGAAARPDLVGTDPTVLRFTVPWAPLPVQAVSWSAREGIEQIDVQMAAGDVAVSGRVTMWRGANGGESDNADVPNQTSSAVVDGHPAVVEQEQFDWGPNQWLTWHPADGLTVQVWLVASGFTRPEGGAAPDRSTVVGVADLVEFANAVRLDRTTACTTPFRVVSVPPQGRLLHCFGSVSMLTPDDETRDGGLLMETGSRLFEINYRTPMERVDVPLSSLPDLPSGSNPPPSESAEPGPDEPAPTGVAATEPSGRLVTGEQTDIRTLRPGLSAWVGHQREGATEAAAILGGLTPAGDPDDPATWPRRPLG